MEAKPEEGAATVVAAADTGLNPDTTRAVVEEHWDSFFVNGLGDFIRVPNLTPMVDPDYLENGKLEKAAECVDNYIKSLDIQGLSRQEFKSDTGLPLVLYIVEGSEGVNKNVMVYGHLDKQPYGVGWEEDLSPTEPTIRDGCMYGRGGADDGYAPFSCMLAIKAAQKQGVTMPRVVLVLETEEESGSPNLIKLLTLASEAIGTPDACFCMDSGAFDYEQLWLTSSLRGIVILDVTVELGKAGYHSGEVGGVVPETFRIMRQLLDRLDNSATGDCMAELVAECPAYKEEEAEKMSKLAGEGMYTKYEVVEGGGYVSQDDLKEMYLGNTWRANMSITGADGLPPIQMAGNVVRASTSVRISMRLPPTLDPQAAQAAMVEKLTTNVPYNAKVTLGGGHAGRGWCMKELPPWLMAACNAAGAEFYDGKPAGSYGMGGSIPFLSELGKMYPETQIVALGVLGPKANAHGPNEMIHLGYTKRLTMCLTHIIASVAHS